MTASETAVRDELRGEDAELTRLIREQGPMNLERACEVMDEFDLQGLVLGEPVNVYHVLGYWPQLGNTRMGQPPTTFAVQFHHYHGDYARTVFVGEPRRAARRAAEAVAHAWQSIRERLRPGMRYSDIVALGQEAVRKGGFNVAIGPAA